MDASLLLLTVARKAPEALDVCSFELVRADGAALPPFSAGSHIDVHLPGGITRQYSLCNDPAQRHRYLIGVLKEPASRGGSRGLHDGVREGDTLCVSAPRNLFALAEGATRSLLLAGGIGVTPLLSMAERLVAAGADFEMHYCARSPERAAFRKRLLASAFADRVAFHFDDGEPQQKLDLDRLDAPAPGAHLYVCGPKGFIDAVLSAARRHGWPEAQLHSELFAAAPVQRAGDGGFDVKLASSGRTIRIAGDQTVAQALASAGVEVPVSCEQGICGTCLTRVLDGEPEHRDMYLSPEEQARNDSFLPCCSRARSACLVLDL